MKVPMLQPCTRCGLKVQAGAGPGKLVWHDCAEVERLRKATGTVAAPADRMDPAEALERVLVVAVKRAPELAGRDLASLVGTLAEMRGDKGGANGKPESGEGLGAWLKLRPDEPEARGAEEAASGQAPAPRLVGGREAG